MFSDSHSAVVAVAIHDPTYLVDFSVKTIQLSSDLDSEHDPFTDHVINELQTYEHHNLSKFVGAGLPLFLLKKCPTLCSRLWLELDIVPISISPESEHLESESRDRSFWDAKCVDEQADSMARKCLM